MDRRTIRDQLKEDQIVETRLVAIVVLSLLLVLVLAARLYYLQVSQHEHFAELATKNRVNQHPIGPVRGLIYARDGQPLALNKRAYNLEIQKNRVDNLDQLIAELRTLIELSDEQIERLYKLVKVRPGFERQILRTNLTDEEAASFSAQQHRLKGAYLVASLHRYYPQGELTGNVVGYVGRINQRDQQTIDTESYAGTDYIGKLGIEANYESILLGGVGSENIETNAHGREVRSLDRQLPSTGKTLYLSVDLDLQQKASDVLQDIEAAVVAIDPQSGEILAFVSEPGYDPNPFVNGISQKAYDALRLSDRRPLLNRALNGRYAPGSTVKGFMGLVGMQNGIGASERVYCPGWFSLPNSSHRYRCWRHWGHGSVNLTDAIEQSCDVYFYNLAKRVGIDELSVRLKEYGFGVATGVDIQNEPTALMPSREWKKRARDQVWYPGETVITGIGQGFMLATPLQLASATATLANRGIFVQPHFLTSVQDPTTGELEEMSYPRKIVNDKVGRAAYDIVINAMVDVVHGSKGTARAQGKNLPFKMAGKTGTAQVRSIAQGKKYDAENTPKKFRDHALFIAFAPVDNPRIALSVVVEHGGGGSRVAAPIARKIIEYYLVDKLKLFERPVVDTPVPSGLVPPRQVLAQPAPVQ